MMNGHGTERLRWSTVEDDQAQALPGTGERVTHPEFEGIEFLHVHAKSLLNRVPEQSAMPFSWTINVYRGCTHACAYCFARPSHKWLELDIADDFDRVIVVKTNAVQRLRAELRAPRWQGEAVALGTNTDPYQRAEGRYRLTRGVVETLTDVHNPFSVLTKGTLVTRDLDVLSTAAAQGICSSVSLSVPTLDEDAWRLTEPGTPHPRRRLEAVAALRDAGVPAGVFIAPILPGLTDGARQLEAVVASAIEAGATSITPIVLHLRPGVREVFVQRVLAERPDLVDKYDAMYRTAYAPKTVRRRIVRIVWDLVAKHGGIPDAPTHQAAGRPGSSGSARPTGPPQQRQSPKPQADAQQAALW